LALLNGNREEKGEEGKDYSLHLLPLRFHHPVARAIFQKQRDTKSNVKKSHRGKKTETGGSDPI